jgi:hypothetical protein
MLGQERLELSALSRPPCTLGTVARLDGLLTAAVPEVALDHAFIEVGQLGAVACDPTQEIADQIETSPSAVTSEPLLDQTRRVDLDQLSVGSTLQAPE